MAFLLWLQERAERIATIYLTVLPQILVVKHYTIWIRSLCINRQPMRKQSPYSICNVLSCNVLSSRSGIDSECYHTTGPDRGIAATVCGFRRGGIAMGRMRLHSGRPMYAPCVGGRIRPAPTPEPAYYSGASCHQLRYLINISKVTHRRAACTSPRMHGLPSWMSVNNKVTLDIHADPALISLCISTIPP